MAITTYFSYRLRDPAIDVEQHGWLGRSLEWPHCFILGLGFVGSLRWVLGGKASKAIGETIDLGDKLRARGETWKIISLSWILTSEHPKKSKKADK